MKIEVITLTIQNEMDVVLAHRRAMQLGRYSGISLSEQTRFATAISEVCRNCLEYARDAQIIFGIVQKDQKYLIEAEVSDKGPGIDDLNKILQREPGQFKGRGFGIIYARRLSDEFEIRSTSKGTIVKMRKYFPSKMHPVSKLIIEGWKKHMHDEQPLSAYEELKVRNLQLLELTDELKQQKEKLDIQMEKIAQLNLRLQTSNKNMQEFTFAISHDLKTPLTSLKLSVALLSDIKVDEEKKPYLGILDRSVLRLDRTIHGLIDILDIQNPEKHVVRDVDLVQILKEVEDDFRREIDSSQATINADFSKAAVLSYIAGYAKSILTNLISNSIKYKSPMPLAIDIRTVATRNGLKLIYSDNGMGMDLNNKNEKLFAPFTRLATKGEGRGIGLYMIKTMVENNGGSVEVKSQPGEGTTFTFHMLKYEPS